MANNQEKAQKRLEARVQNYQDASSPGKHIISGFDTHKPGSQNRNK